MAKQFTVDEANRLLPKLEGELRQIQSALAEARAKQREKEMFRAVGRRSDGELILQKEYHEADQALRERVYVLESLIERVHAEGCRIKDPERGLIDFPAVLDGRHVLLCWELGEPRVAYYHDYESGYAGRRPIDEGPQPAEG